jgi:glycosyltransferase involved in cell wall biosynthesis
LGIERETFAVGVVGILSRKKNQLDLINGALPLVLRKSQRSHFYFLGDVNYDSEYTAACHDALEMHGIQDRVTFLGFQRNVAEWLSAMDLTVVGSQKEGLARAMIESLASGTPVVSFDVASAQEVLGLWKAGIVCKTGDYVRLTESILCMEQDIDARSTFARNGRAFVENECSWAIAAKRFHRIAAEGEEKCFPCV